MKKQISFFVVLMVLAFATAGVAQDNPCNPCTKKGKNPCAKAMNPCNPCAAKSKHMFRIDDPMKRNTATFTSNAPLEDIVGTTNEISGYITFNPMDPKAGSHGKVMVPVASLNSGIPLRDEHLRSADWLNAAKHPNIIFEFDNVSDVKVVKKTDEAVTYDAKLHGAFEIHGVKKKILVPARFTYMQESEKTKMRAPGDLIAGRASFNVPLKAYGIKGMEGVVGARVAEEVGVDIRFVASNGAVAAGNPCNPCARSANPCNPCAKKK